jgi:hypothetical protein
MEMIAFHGKEEIKKFYLNRVQEHIDLDEIVKGVYFEDGEPGKRKMCGVGCTIHSSDHLNYETELGIPQILAKLEDSIFEKLPNEVAKTWPLRFLESINVGADLSKVWAKFMIFILTDISQCNLKHTQCKIVADCFQKELDGEKIDWAQIKNAAAAAAADAADYADAAADAYAAYAADAYAAAAAIKKSKEKARIAQAEKLLELLREEK